uniref:Acyl-CoA thioesterase 7 n=1 Tax=Oryctolagus cuniculus TaxID=9986 RepID=A0A5F9DJU4_RABIT
MAWLRKLNSQPARLPTRSRREKEPAAHGSWIMRPDDANIAGNVHGGTILKMIEEAGAIISTRHCNSQNGERCVAALARVERTDFLSPMCIGEVAHVSAEITYTSKHSVEVQVNVMSENILTGTKKLTNKATLWYVPLSLKNVDKVLEVPPVVYSRQEQEEEGRKRYEAQKLERMETKWRNGDIVQPVLNPEPNTVSYSQSSLIHLVGPSDCTLHGFVHGGVTMKLMDEVAGIVAARHCKTNIVTASVDAINFHDKIRKGTEPSGGERGALGSLCLPCHAPWVPVPPTPGSLCLPHHAPWVPVPPTPRSLGPRASHAMLPGSPCLPHHAPWVPVPPTPCSLGPCASHAWVPVPPTPRSLGPRASHATLPGSPCLPRHAPWVPVPPTPRSLGPRASHATLPGSLVPVWSPVPRGMGRRSCVLGPRCVGGAGVEGAALMFQSGEMHSADRTRPLSS